MLKRTALLLACFAFAAAHVSAQAIDPARSTVTVHVDKAGLFSVFGHKHTVRARIQQGQVDTGARAVALSFASAQLRVLDPDVSKEDRAEIQRTMLGPQVLDTERYPEIRFQSTQVESEGKGWRVQGQLALHGATKPVVMKVKSNGDSYRGQVRLKQSDFGLKPISLAGGTIKVKDEVTIEFEIVLVKTRRNRSTKQGPGP